MNSIGSKITSLITRFVRLLTLAEKLKNNVHIHPAPRVHVQELTCASLACCVRSP